MQLIWRFFSNKEEVCNRVIAQFRKFEWPCFQISRFWFKKCWIRSAEWSHNVIITYNDNKEKGCNFIFKQNVAIEMTHEMLHIMKSIYRTFFSIFYNLDNNIVLYIRCISLMQSVCVPMWNPCVLIRLN